jgi:DNA-3-methyladenine glycosylase II
MLSRLRIDRSIRIMSLRQTRSASRSSVQNNSMLPPQAANTAKKRKASVGKVDTDGPNTPKRKTKTAPLLTPTPSAVNAIAHTAGASSPATPKSKKPRRADPKATNAPLQTPGGSKVLKSYPSDLLENGSPSKGGVTTTENLLEKACAHLCTVDAKLKPLVERHTCKMFTPEGLAEHVEPFEALVSSIISQQVRVRARNMQSI